MNLDKDHCQTFEKKWLKNAKFTVYVLYKLTSLLAKHSKKACKPIMTLVQELVSRNPHVFLWCGLGTGRVWIVEIAAYAPRLQKWKKDFMQDQFHKSGYIGLIKKLQFCNENP